MHDELGIMHRDLKPDNIMVNENPLQAKIIDFGTCKDLTMEAGPHTSYVSTSRRKESWVITTVWR